MKNLLKFSVITLILSWQTVQACSCEQWVSASQMVKKYDAVFLGIPEHKSEFIREAGEDDWGTVVNTKFSVVRNYKNAAKKSITIESWADTGANCGASFEKDDGLWLVFASKGSNGKLGTSACSLTGVEASDMRTFLRELNQI